MIKHYNKVKELSFERGIEAQGIINASKEKIAQWLAETTAKSVDYWKERLKATTIKVGILIKDDEGLLGKTPEELYTEYKVSTMPKEVEKEFEE